MKFRRFIAIFSILVVMLLVIINPARYLVSVKDGLILFWTSVLPALFPFFFFTKLLTGLGFPESVGKLLKKPVNKFFHTPDISGYIFFMSTLSGYPIGAKLTADFYTRGLITENDAKKIISFCSTSAPLFIIGTIGTFMLKNLQYAVIILISHYLSAIFTGLLFCNLSKIKSVAPIKTLTTPDNIIGETVTDSVISVLSVGGLIAIFSLIIDVISDSGILNIFGKFSAVLIGIIEMTRGSKEVILSSFSTPITLSILTGLVSFGGMCVYIQAMSFLKSAKIKPLYYLSIKITHGLIGAIICYIISIIYFVGLHR